MSPPVRCVVLNACFTRRQGEAIARHVPCVIGMSREISDPAAIVFAEAFYLAIAYGLPVRKAFELGCQAIHMQYPRERIVPVLLADPGVAENLCFTF
jgi:hypothetical protein